MPQLVTVYGGGFQSPSGSPLASITLRLAQDVAESSHQIAAGRITTLALDANGNISPSPGAVLWAPAAYQVIAYTALGLAAWSGQITVPDVASFSLTP